MPRGDGTGPAGRGAMTGRGRGYCTGFAGPGCVDNDVGYGRGRGFFGRMRNYAFGAGRQRFGYPYNNPGFQTDEKEYLSGQVRALEGQLKQAKERLGELDKDSE
ncbi:MAG: DUF5320 domain-containing protein [Clostridium sp.]|nr:DUF5320 domain-containing protein [Clostridium sp.]